MISCVHGLDRINRAVQAKVHFFLSVVRCGVFDVCVQPLVYV